jgi:hypothetical protein
MKMKKGNKKKKKELDYLLIPTGWEEQRKDRTLKELETREVKNIFLLAGCDSEEDMILLGKRLKGGEKIAIVTFPLHYLKYIWLIKKAQKQGIFPGKVKTENVKTGQTPKQFIYGILSLLEELLDSGRKLDYRTNRNHDKFMYRISRPIKEFLRKH